MKSLRILLLPLVAVCAANPGFCEDYPNRLVRLIDGQSLIGLNRIEKTNDYIITVVTDAEADLERDVANLEIPKLFSKHPTVAERGNARLAAFRESIVKKESALPHGVKYGQPKLHVSPTAGELHRVQHVGDDYILLESTADKEPRKFAINSRLIREIRWYRGPGFSTSVRHLRENETEQ